VLAWRRSFGDETHVLAVNMSESDAALGLAGTVVVASDGRGEGEPFPGMLLRDRAVLLADTGIEA
jgi:hypothetical protein